jgi:hypothetical protein
MDDYILKPYKIEDLSQKILKWANPGSTAGTMLSDESGTV